MASNNSQIVVKSNEIVGASYQLSLYEQRILLACIAQIDSTKPFPIDNEFEISASVIGAMVGVEICYPVIKEAAESLKRRVLKLDKPFSDKPEIDRTEFNWVSRVSYSSKQSKIFLTFSREIAPYLTELTQRFTQYKIQHIAQFKSIYSIRLYELLCQWQSVGNYAASLEWLRQQWQLPESYLRINNLKDRVIDVAVAEINEHSNFSVEYTQRKEGRTVTHLIFTFKLKESAAKKSPTKPLSVDEFVRQNPTRTKGKTAAEVQKLMAKTS